MFVYHMNFTINMSNSITKCGSFFTRMILNLQINSRRTDIFIMLNHPIQEQDMSFHLSKTLESFKLLKFPYIGFTHFLLKVKNFFACSIRLNGIFPTLRFFDNLLFNIRKLLVFIDFICWNFTELFY